jgi:succinate dehydrogenase / fumarate reductase cytochrome b subunit
MVQAVSCILSAQHFTINITLRILRHLVGLTSSGYEWIKRQFLQPVLIIGVIFHFVMGFILEIRESKCPLITSKFKAPRPSWASLVMIISFSDSGILLRHFTTLDSEMIHKYIRV